MSYSITARAASKALALGALADKFDDQVVAHQPIHAADRQQALAAASLLVSLLPEDANRDVSVALNGSISTMNGAVSYVTCAVHAHLVERDAA